MSAWISVQDLHLSRGGRPVLRGITSELTGAAVGLVGANGAGKSTLIGALLGVLKPERGSVRVMNLEVPRQAMEVRARGGVMAEQAGVFPGGSGVDAVAFAGALSGLGRREALRRAHRALDALDVGEERYRPSKTYSTGMRQRTKLAMCLVHDPEFLILDEPTVGLDPPGRRQLLRLIRDLRDEGRRILLSTHILQDAEFVCDDMLLLEAGTVAFSGPVTDLTQGSADIYLAKGEGLDAAFVSMLQGAGMTAELRDGARVALTVTGDDELRRFWAAVEQYGAEVRSLARDVPTLEQAVVDVMEGSRAR